MHACACQIEEDSATNVKVPQEVKMHDICNRASIKKKQCFKILLFEYLDFKQCMLNSRRKVMHTNIKIPDEVKSTRYLQLSCQKKTRQHVLLNLSVSQSQDPRYVKVENSFNYTKKLDLSRDSEFILMQSSPPFDNYAVLYVMFCMKCYRTLAMENIRNTVATLPGPGNRVNLIELSSENCDLNLKRCGY